MCVYCVIGDHTFKYDPPFKIDPQQYPQIPQPVNPLVLPWNLERLREYHDMLKKVKELEDKLGCPCVPNKADYLKLLKQQIRKLEAKKPKRKTPRKRR